MATAAKRSKLEKLIATFERFAEDIASVPDAHAQKLHKMGSEVRAFVATAREASPQPPTSAIVSGLEQGLREIPVLVAGVADEWRVQISEALNTALAFEYPELLERDHACLQKVITRGNIRTKAEFYLVRHQVDLIEGVRDSEQSLHLLYSLLDAYESER
jgi:hypothetical protein